MTTQQTLDLYLLARSLYWREEIQKLDILAIRNIQSTLQSAKKAIQNELNERNLKHVDAWLNEVLLSFELENVATIETATYTAGTASLDMYNNMLSFGGKAVNVATVGFTAEQFKSWFNYGLMNASPLNGWIDNAFDIGVKQRIFDVVKKGGILGKGIGDIEKDIVNKAINDGFAITNREAQNIARTYIQTANIGAMKEVYKANDSLFNGYEWCATLDNRTCRLCAPLDGTVYANLNQLPRIPRHVNCLTAETTVFVPDKVSAFISTYRGSVFEVTLSSGARFTSTANHMFLGKDGFIPAKFLTNRDYVFYSPTETSFISPDNDRYLSTIDKVINSMSKSNLMTTVRVPRAPEYFHNDGEFVESEINIIAPKSLLRGDLETFFGELFEEMSFIFTKLSTSSFDTLGSSYMKLFIFWLSTNSHLSGKSVLDILGLSPFGHHESIGNSIISHRNFIPDQYASNNISSNAITVCNSIFGNSANVIRNNTVNIQSFTDSFTHNNVVFFQDFINKLCILFKKLGYRDDFFSNIVHSDNSSNIFTRNSWSFHNSPHKFGKVKVESIKEKQFNGDVFDFQTLTSLYHVNGAISSNCRCFLIPKVKSWKELGVNLEELERTARPWVEREKGDLTDPSASKIIETGKHKGNFGSWWSGLPEEKQRVTVGAVRTRLINRGELSWDNIVDKNTGRLRTLQELGFSLSGEKI